MIVAVDGTAASGKGTLVTKLAKYFNLASLDTGLLYRSVAFSMIKAGDNLKDQEKAAKHATSIDYCLMDSPRLRNSDVGAASSKIAAMKAVRLILLDFQRKFAKSPPNGKSGTILDGRDIATVVCPDADFKIFVTANIEIRAKRRWKQLIESDEPAIYARVLEDLRERDTRDSTRKNAPLLKDSDAISIDTSYLDAEKTFETARNYIASRDFNRQRD